MTDPTIEELAEARWRLDLARLFALTAQAIVESERERRAANQEVHAVEVFGDWAHARLGVAS